MEALTISKDLSLFPSESGNMSVYHKGFPQDVPARRKGDPNVALL